MNDRPLVSVLTPSFNQGRWLVKNLESVRLQTYDKIEHIVMDGGSSDQTIQLLQAASGSIRWWSEPDRGQSHALNKAFAESKGEIVGWINSDDAYFHAKSVEWAVEALLRHPAADIIYGHAAELNSEGTLLHLRWVPPYSPSLLLLFNFIVQPAAFIRRSAIGDQLVDESLDFTMDRALWLRLAKEGRRFLRLNKILAANRRHVERKSQSLDEMWAERNPQDRAYGAPTGRWTRPARWMLDVGVRVAGLRLIPTILSSDWLLEQRPSWKELTLRQVATRHRNMHL